MRSYIVSAGDVGLPVYPVSAIKGGNPAHNATELRKLLLGEHGTYRDTVLFNSAAALVIAREVADLRDGVEAAAEAIEKGLANALLSCRIDYQCQKHTGRYATHIDRSFPRARLRSLSPRW